MLGQERPKIKEAIILALSSLFNSRKNVREAISSWAQSQLLFSGSNRQSASANDLLKLCLPPSDDNPMVKARALLLLGGATPKFVTTAQQIQEICANFLSDTDARVRLASLEALISLHAGKNFVEFKHYRSAVVALTDDDEYVRLAAIRLIWHMANTYQSQNVASSQQGVQRVIALADDAFMKICSMATDTSVGVREESCKLLGTMEGVSLPLLQQALSKKLVKVEIAPRENNQAMKSFGGASTVDADAMEIDAAATGDLDVIQVSAVAALIESGAYGALIHALEDEFAEVRCAAVKTIATLSLRSEEFAKQSIEFLVDMFNDENEQVRVATISSLESFGSRSHLAFPQIQHMVALLGDQSSSLRESVRSFLKSDEQRLPDAPSMVVVISTLLHNLMMYPVDFTSIFETLRKLGARQPLFVELSLDKIVPEIFMRPPMQRHIDEIEYQATLVVLFNAVALRTSLLSVLPLHFQNHYVIMRDRHPTMVPAIHALDMWAPSQLVARECLKKLHANDFVEPEFNDIHSEEGLAAELASCSRYLQQALRLTKLVVLDPTVETSSLGLYASIISRIHRITTVCYRKTTTSRTSAVPFAMWNVADILRDLLGLTVALMSPSGPSTVQDWTKKIIHKTYVFQAIFSGLPDEMFALLYRWRLHAHLAVIFDLSRRYEGKISPIALDTAITTLQRRLKPSMVSQKIATLVQELVVAPQDLLKEMDEILSFLDDDWQVLHWPFTELDSWKCVEHMHAVLRSPMTNQLQPIEYIAGLPFELKVAGSVGGTKSPESIKIKMRSPTGQETCVQPSLSIPEESSSPPDPASVDFNLVLLVNEKRWPAQATMELDVVVATPTDFHGVSSSSDPISADWEKEITYVSLLNEATHLHVSSGGSRRAHQGAARG